MSSSSSPFAVSLAHTFKRGLMYRNGAIFSSEFSAKILLPTGEIQRRKSFRNELVNWTERAPIQSKCNIHPLAEEKPNWDWACEGGKFGGKSSKGHNIPRVCIGVMMASLCLPLYADVTMIEMFVLWGDHLLARSISLWKISCRGENSPSARQGQE